MTARRALHGYWLGRRRYSEVHALQNQLQEARKLGQIPDTVLLLEHEPVITLGRGAHAANVLFTAEELAQLGVETVVTERGGDVTLHAPGQLVGYPILDLNPDRRDVRRYVRDLTETMRRFAHEHGVDAGPHDEHIGLWVDRQAPAAWPGQEHAQNLVKLGAIGVHLSRWVTKHGFALNLTTDLDLFRLIVPCGISSLGVTSIEELTGEALTARAAAGRALELLAEVLDAEVATFDESGAGPDLTGCVISQELSGPS